MANSGLDRMGRNEPPAGSPFRDEPGDPDPVGSAMGRTFRLRSLLILITAIAVYLAVFRALSVWGVGPGDAAILSLYVIGTPFLAGLLIYHAVTDIILPTLRESGCQAADRGAGGDARGDSQRTGRCPGG